MAQPFNAGVIVYAKDIHRLARFYAAVADLEVMHEVDDHIVLESEVVEVVIVALPAAVAQRIVIKSPPDKREATAFKIAFAVASLAEAREAARANEGEVYPAGKEWSFQGLRVCDGVDPEGNVFQLRELPKDAGLGDVED